MSRFRLVVGCPCQYPIWDTVSTDLKDDERYSPTIQGVYTWPLPEETGFYRSLYAGPLTPTECFDKAPHGTVYRGCYAGGIFKHGEYRSPEKGPDGMTPEVRNWATLRKKKKSRRSASEMSTNWCEPNALDCPGGSAEGMFRPGTTAPLLELTGRIITRSSRLQRSILGQPASRPRQVCFNLCDGFDFFGLENGDEVTELRLSPAQPTFLSPASSLQSIIATTG